MPQKRLKEKKEKDFQHSMYKDVILDKRIYRFKVAEIFQRLHNKHHSNTSAKYINLLTPITNEYSDKYNHKIVN